MIFFVQELAKKFKNSDIIISTVAIFSMTIPEFISATF